MARWKRRQSLRAMWIYTILGAATHYPLAAFAFERVVHLHSAATGLGPKKDSGARLIIFKRNRGNVHLHQIHVEAGLRCARAQVIDDRLADRLRILDIARAGRQEYRGQQKRRYFHTPIITGSL